MSFTEQKVLFGIPLPSSPPIEGPILVEQTAQYQTYLEEDKRGFVRERRVYTDGSMEQSDNAIPGPLFNQMGGLRLPGGRRILWQYRVAIQEQQA